MVSISRAWYNGSHTMGAKPIKSLELLYTMIQFLVKYISKSGVLVSRSKLNVTLYNTCTSWNSFISS